MILQVAMGIVLGYVILSLLPLIFTEEFWVIIGSILGIGAIIIAFIALMANIKELAPIICIGMVVFVVVAVYKERVAEQRFSKLKFTIDDQDASVVVEDSNNEVVITYTGIRNHIAAAERFFEEKHLNKDDYSVRVPKSKGTTYSCIYTRKQKKKKKISIWENK